VSEVPGPLAIVVVADHQSRWFGRIRAAALGPRNPMRGVLAAGRAAAHDGRPSPAAKAAVGAVARSWSDDS
jgi:hypothetical protein